MLESFALTFAVDCSSCARPIPINAIKRTARFAACSDVRRIEAETWAATTTTWLEGHPEAGAMRPFQIRTPEGVVKIEGDRAWWAAPLEYLPLKPESDQRLVTRARVQPGDRVLALGRVTDDGGTPTIHAGGHEALVLFAAPDAPRAVLRQLIVGWLGSAVLLLSTIAGCVGLALYMWSHAR